MRSALDIWNTPPPVVLVSLSFLKTLKCSGKISPFLTEGSNHDSVALIMSGLCRLFSTSMSCYLSFLIPYVFVYIATIIS